MNVSGRRLWPLALSVHLGDSFLTYLGTEILFLTSESAPLASFAYHSYIVHYGHVSHGFLIVLLSIKAAVLAPVILLWRFYPSVGDIGPDPYRSVIPTLVALRGLYLVALNVGEIVSAL